MQLIIWPPKTSAADGKSGRQQTKCDMLRAAGSTQQANREGQHATRTPRPALATVWPVLSRPVPHRAAPRRSAVGCGRSDVAGWRRLRRFSCEPSAESRQQRAGAAQHVATCRDVLEQAATCCSMLQPTSRLRAQIFLQQSAEFLRQHPDLVASKDAPKPAAADGPAKPGTAEEEGWDISYGERKDQAR